MPTASQDLLTTHSFLALLFAGYQGAYASMNTLGQLGHIQYTPETLEQYDRILGRLAKWTQELYQGIPLLSTSWKEVETFDASAAFDDLDRLRKEIITTITEIRIILGKGDGEQLAEDTKILLAACSRFVYGRDFYLRAFVDFGTATQNQPMVQNTLPMVEPSQAALADVDAIFQKLRDGAPDRDLVTQIAGRAQHLPRTFEVQTHEMLLVHRMYGPPVTFLDIGVSTEEATRWQASQIPPTNAAYWRAFEIGPEEAYAWIAGGINQSGEARQWRDGGFSPGDVTGWAQAGIPPVPAATWKAAGYSAEETVKYSLQGVFDPPPKKGAFRKRDGK